MDEELCNLLDREKCLLGLIAFVENAILECEETIAHAKGVLQNFHAPGLDEETDKQRQWQIDWIASLNESLTSYWQDLADFKTTLDEVTSKIYCLIGTEPSVKPPAPNPDDMPDSN